MQEMETIGKDGVARVADEDHPCPFEGVIEVIYKEVDLPDNRNAEPS